MKRIMIIGSGGAGKSTLAKHIGRILELEVIHLDALYWSPGWKGMTRDEWIKLQKDHIAKKEEWLMDGNFGSTMELRLEAADTIIFLDLPRLLCTYRVIKRRFQYHRKNRPDMGKGCPEKLDKEFLKWVWEFTEVKRPEILEKLAELSGDKKIIHLQSRREVKQFLSDL